MRDLLASTPAAVACSVFKEVSPRMGIDASADMKRLGHSGSYWKTAGVSGLLWCSRNQGRPVSGFTCQLSTRVGDGGHGVMEGDVVEYPLPVECRSKGRNKGVGVVAELHSQAAHVEPLVQEEDGWIYDERQQALVVPIGEVRVLQTWYRERMVPDRISNPHGEHAESLWVIEDFLSPDCGPSSSLVGDD